jgi:hypothetical protein
MTDRDNAEQDMMWMEGSNARTAIRAMTAAQRERVRNQVTSAMWTYIPRACLVLIVNRFNLPFLVDVDGNDVKFEYFLKNEAGVTDGE